MSDALVCPQGHRWEPPAEASDGAGRVCPICGADAAPDPLSELKEDGTVSQRPQRAPVSAVSRPEIAGYEILGELGHGGMGVVYQARQRVLNRLVAIKMVLGGSLAGQQQLARFHAEAEAVARLQHPNVVAIYEVGTHDGRPYFALEYVPGGSLARKLNGAPLPPREAARLAETLARAVHAAHQRGVVHRDLKPSNILLAQDGTPKIADFGLAKFLDEAASGSNLEAHTAAAYRTQTGAVLGTPSYMAPEQALGASRDASPLVDVYALGAILYELLTGRPPFRADSAFDTLVLVRREEPVPVRRLQPTVPRDLETICLKCLHKEPGRRYADAEALAEDLRRFLSGEPIWARPTSLVERALKWVRRRPAGAGLVVLVVFLVLAAAGASLANRPIPALTLLVGPAAVLGLAGIFWQWRRAEGQRRQAEEQRKQAEAARGEAEAQRQKAEAARQEAERQAHKATAALARAEAGLYFHRIAQAEREWATSNPRRTRDLLDACPPGLRHWEWRYLQRLGHAEVFTLRHRDWVRSVAYDADGRRLATAGGLDRKVRLWDAATGRKLASLGEHRGCVRDVAFRPDGRWLAVADEETVCLWDLETRQVSVLRGHTDPVARLVFSPDGRSLASASADGTVRLWDVTGRQEIRCLSGHKESVWAVAISADGLRLATAGQDRTVRVWDPATGRELRVLHGHADAAVSVAFSPDGRRLASASTDQTVRVWNAETGQEQLTLRGHADAVWAVAFSPDGRHLASASKDRTVKVWDADAGRELRTFRGHADSVWSVAFHPDGRHLASASSDHRVKVWEAEADQGGFVLARHQEPVTCVAFDPSGGMLVSGGGDPSDGRGVEVKVWDIAGRRLVQALRGHTGAVSCLVFSPDGSLLASAGNDAAQGKGEVILWDAASREKRLTFRGHTRGIVGVGFTPNGAMVASASLDGTIQVWYSGTGEVVLTLRAHVGSLTALAFSPDGRQVASTSGDAIKGTAALKLWDPLTGREFLNLEGSLPETSRLAFSPDGRALALAGRDRTLRLLELPGGRAAHVLRGHTAAVTGVAFSPDGQRLASASHDKTLKIWETHGGQEIITLRGHGGEVTSVAFSPDGHLLASASTDQTVRVWDATPVSERTERPPGSSPLPEP
jgi:WD40 repeat protein